MRPRPRTRRPAHLLVALLAAVLFLLTVPAPTLARADGGTVGLSINPATATGPDSRTRFSYKVKPGQRVSDHVLVRNVGSRPLKVTLLSAQAYNAEDGSYALRPTDTKASDVASWVRFDGDKARLVFTLPAGKSTIVGFSITVPANASPGDHPAGIIAAATSSGDGQLAVERRIANRLYVRVAGDLQPVLTASSFTGSYAGGLNPFDGTVTVTAVLNNTGNVALSGVVDVDVRTWFGALVGTSVQTEVSEILPGNTRTVSFQVAGVPQAGYVQPHLLLRSSVVGDAPDPGPLPVIERDTFLLALPWVLLALVALGVGGWFLLRWWRRREAQRAAEWAAYTEEEAKRRAAETEVGKR